MAATAKTRSVTAHVPVELAERVDEVAERLERSKNWIVKQALSAWLDQEEERSRLTRCPGLGREPEHGHAAAGASLMELKWTSKALSDLARLYEFLSTVNQPAAARTVQQLTSAPTTLLTNPRIGERLEEFDPRDVRRILVGHYEMRYEIADSNIYLLRLWHTREDR